MMNHYVSTYQKDYVSPLVSSECRPKSPTAILRSCTCTEPRLTLKPGLVDVKAKDCFDLSRTRPAPWLPEPKIYPTKPRLRIQDLVQPRCCMKTLEIECPDFYQILEKEPSDGRPARVEADRMKTTYQLDYSDPAAARIAQQLSRSRDMDDQQLQCRVPIKITIEADCLPQCRPPTMRCEKSARKYDFKQKNGLKRKRTCEDEGRLTQLPSWKTEYQDSINKIGETIMKVKLHQAKKKVVPVLAMSN